MVAVAVDGVVGDGEVVAVVVRVEPVLHVVAHGVVGPDAALVTVGVVAVVHAVDLGVEDIAVHVGALEDLRVGVVLTEASHLPGEAVRFRVEVSQVAHHRVHDVLVGDRGVLD